MKTILLILISTLLLSISCTKDNPITANNGPKLYSFSAYLDDNMKFCANQFTAIDIKDSTLIKSLKDKNFINDSEFWIMSVPLDSSHYINRNFDYYEKQDTFLITGRLAKNEDFTFGSSFCLGLVDVLPELFFITKIQKK